MPKLELRASGTPGERLALAAQTDAPQRAADLQKALGFGDAEMQQALDEATKAGLVRHLDGQRYWAAQSMAQLLHAAIAELRGYHSSNPLRLGMPRPQLQSRLNVKLNLLDLLIENEDQLTYESNLVRLRDHTIRFSPEQNERAERVMRRLRVDPYSPPGIAELNENCRRRCCARAQRPAPDCPRKRGHRLRRRQL